jgi:sugar-specific transcriptional regulator TrmB
MSLSFLQSIGLTKHEIQLYELLLKTGESPVASLVKKMKVKRPLVYHILDQLETKGLVTKREVVKKLHYTPLPPSQLLELTEEKYKEMERTRANLQAVLPSLASSYILSVEQPIVRMYEGVEGLKEMYMDILKDRKPGLAVLQGEDMNEELAHWVTTYFTKERAKKKMPLKVIITGTDAKDFMQHDVEARRFSRSVPQHLFPFQHEVTVYGDKVAFMHYKKGDKLVGLIITQPHFAQTLKAFFDLAWIGATEFQK